MKILWISHLVPYPPKAGVIIRSYNLIKQLGSNNDIDLFMFNQKRLLEAFYPSSNDGMQSALDELTPYTEKYWVQPIPSEKSRYHKIILLIKSLFTLAPYTINWLKSSNAAISLEKITQDNDYDLIHFDTISLDIYRQCVPTTAKLVMNHHNIESHMVGRRASKEKNLLKKLYLYIEYLKLSKYEKKNLVKYDGHITCSNDDANRLRKLFNLTQIHVIPNGIDISGIEPEREITSGKLLFIGGLSWYPNADAMLHFLHAIYPILKERDVRCSIDIIGRNPPSEIYDIASLENAITIHGYVDDINDFYKYANIYICPIRDGGGTKLKILDAFAHKMAVVAYPIACEGIDVINDENVMIAEDEEQFAEIIAILINNPDKCYALGENAYRLVMNKYNYNLIGKQLSEYYHQLITDHR